MDALRLRKSEKIATVVGATGLVGMHLLRHLEHDDSYKEVYAWSRSKPKLEKNSRIQWVVMPDDIDLSSKHDSSEPARVFNILPEGNDFFSCLGTTKAKAGSEKRFYEIDFNLNYLLAKAAIAKNYSQYFIVSAAGADPRSFFLYNRTKGELELAIKSLPFWGLHIFQPSLLLGDRNENRWGEKAAESLLNAAESIFGTALRGYRPIEAEKVALAMLASAKDTFGGIKIHSNSEMNNLSLGSDIPTT